MPEGADPAAGLVYLTAAGGALIGVDPLTGHGETSVPGSGGDGSAGMYVVRDGVALGLDSGQSGEAWGYDMAAGRVTWTVVGAALAALLLRPVRARRQRRRLRRSDVVVIAACPHLSARPPRRDRACADPELVAFTL